MQSERQRHWESVYENKAAGERSWFQPRAATSLELLDAIGFSASTPVIDVGGGTARLVDALLARGATDATVLDISEAALAEAQGRLGADAARRVRWVRADITEAALAGPYAIWHDRAVFHFLTDEADRRAYLERLNHTLTPGGHVVIATFALDGPEKCSGLPVVRYSPESLGAVLGEAYTLVATRREPHETPSGRVQSFVYCVFRRG